MFFVVYTLGWSLRVRGRHNVPRTGPALLVANHQSFLDPMMVGLVAPRHVWYLARKTLFKNPVLGTLMRFVNSVPLDQEGVGKEGIKAIIQQLQAGRAVVVFPEGNRTPDGQMQPLEAGIQLLIRRVPVPVVPVGIAGAYHAWPRWRKLPWPAPLFLPPAPETISVVARPALDGQRLAEMPRQELLELLTNEIAQAAAAAEKLRRK
jgi:1-acyl-sn-glycerol-3-phosphate acyltransferase